MKTIYTSTIRGTSTLESPRLLVLLTILLLTMTHAFGQGNLCQQFSARPITGQDGGPFEKEPCPGSLVIYEIQADINYTSVIWEEPRAAAGFPPTGWEIVMAGDPDFEVLPMHQIKMRVGKRPGNVKVTVTHSICGSMIATRPVVPKRAFEVDITGPDELCELEEHTFTADLTETDTGNPVVGLTPQGGVFTYFWTVSAGWQIMSGQGTNKIVARSNTGLAGTVTVTVTNVNPGTPPNGSPIGIGPGRYCNGNANKNKHVNIADDCGPIIPLPVEMISFNAARSQASVLLTWATAQEINNDRFEIERSADGREFTSIATVAGNGTTHQRSDYRYSDDRPFSSVSYYRLKQVDTDGKFEYSAVKAVRASNMVAEPVFAFPNPTRGTISIELPADVAPDALVRITSVTGQVVYSGSASDLAASNQTVDLTRFTSGIYIMTVSSGKDHQSLRISKL